MIPEEGKGQEDDQVDKEGRIWLWKKTNYEGRFDNGIAPQKDVRVVKRKLMMSFAESSRESLCGYVSPPFYSPLLSSPLLIRIYGIRAWFGSFGDLLIYILFNMLYPLIQLIQVRNVLSAFNIIEWIFKSTNLVNFGKNALDVISGLFFYELALYCLIRIYDTFWLTSKSNWLTCYQSSYGTDPYIREI